VHRDVDHAGLGVTSLLTSYVTRNTERLTHDLNDNGRLGQVTQGMCRKLATALAEHLESLLGCLDRHRSLPIIPKSIIQVLKELDITGVKQLLDTSGMYIISSSDLKCFTPVQPSQRPANK